MADDASRRWDLSDSDLLTYFNAAYPQDTSWSLRTLPSAMLSAVTGSLSQRRSVPPSLRIAPSPPPAPGGSGNASVIIPWVFDPTCVMRRATPSPSSCSSRNDIAPAKSLPATDLFALEQWRTRSVTLPRVRRAGVPGPSPKLLWRARLPSPGSSSLVEEG